MELNETNDDRSFMARGKTDIMVNGVSFMEEMRKKKGDVVRKTLIRRKEGSYMKGVTHQLMTLDGVVKITL